MLIVVVAVAVVAAAAVAKYMMVPVQKKHIQAKISVTENSKFKLIKNARLQRNSASRFIENLVKESKEARHFFGIGIGKTSEIA